MKAIILARVSTKEQEEGYSIAAQRQRLVEYCARKNFDVIRTFELIESSTRGERKEFTVMLDFAKAQNQTIAIVADAVARNADELGKLVLADSDFSQEFLFQDFTRVRVLKPRLLAFPSQGFGLPMPPRYLRSHCHLKCSDQPWT